MLEGAHTYGTFVVASKILLNEEVLILILYVQINLAWVQELLNVLIGCSSDVIAMGHHLDDCTHSLLISPPLLLQGDLRA